MVKINIIGELFGTSGYSVHVRNLSHALLRQGADVRIETSLPQGWERLVTDAELNMITKPFTHEYHTVMINLPHTWSLGMGNNPKTFSGFFVWEGDKIHKSWIQHIMKADNVFVPSKHVKDVVEKTVHESGMIARLPDMPIIPHGYDSAIFYPKEKKKDRPFTFVCNKGWKGGMWDRGGIQFLLKAYTEEFTNKDDVQLIIKLNPAYISQGFDFKKEVEQLGIPKRPDSPVVMVNTDYLHATHINDFYNEGDVYVCAQMGDAFNIPGIEAMACGLPTIQTAFGGQTDYVTESNGWLIPMETMGSPPNDLLYEGINWAIPDVQALRKIMREAYSNPDVCVAKGKQALLDVQGYTWDNSAKKLLCALKQAGIR